MSDITEAVETCIILHNMMVEEHRDQEKEEQHNWYDFNNSDNEHNNNAPIVPAERICGEATDRDRITHSTTAIFYDSPAIVVILESYQQQRLLFRF
jgi:hypothetical protein